MYCTACVHTRCYLHGWDVCVVLYVYTSVVTYMVEMCVLYCMCVHLLLLTWLRCMRCTVCVYIRCYLHGWDVCIVLYVCTPVVTYMVEMLDDIPWKTFFCSYDDFDDFVEVVRCEIKYFNYPWEHSVGKTRFFFYYLVKIFCKHQKNIGWKCGKKQQNRISDKLHFKL